ncbi:MAG: hypothetical protein ACKVQW_16755 [Pyrinomonadaceae bacterium]
MPTKYDTNPLDPDFPAKIRAAAEAEVKTQVLSETGAAETRQFAKGAPTASTEQETRKFFAADAAQYSQPFDGQFVPASYQPANLTEGTDAAPRKIEPFGIPEHIVIAAPYVPWFIGMVAGALILFLVPKSETKVRFHAAQGLAAHVGILAVTTILGIVDNITDIAAIGNLFFTLVTSIMLVVFAIKAWQGKPVHIESVEPLTNWLEDKINPTLGRK